MLRLRLRLKLSSHKPLLLHRRGCHQFGRQLQSSRHSSSPYGRYSAKDSGIPYKCAAFDAAQCSTQLAAYVGSVEPALRVA